MPVIKVSSLKEYNIPKNHVEEAYKEYQIRYGKLHSLEELIENGEFGIGKIIELLYQRSRRMEYQKGEL